MLNDHQSQQNAQYYPQNANTSTNPNVDSNHEEPQSQPHCSGSQDVAKKFLFAVEDFLDTVRKLKNDYENGMRLSVILILFLPLPFILYPCTQSTLFPSKCILHSGRLNNIGNEPSQLFDDIKHHLSKQNRIVPEALTRLLDGVKC